MILLSVPALAAGFSVDAEGVSSYGPDRYLDLHVQASGGPDLDVGARVLGGTRPAWLGTAARTVRLAEPVTLRGELDLGLLRRLPADAREEAVTGGFELGLRGDVDPVVLAIDGGWIGGVGWRVEGGVDAPLGSAWSLSPRLRFETWSGDRDPAARVGLGVRKDASSGAWLALSVSAGGRDVVHMGPGVALSVGFRPVARETP